jgi:hypothetical protein
MSVTNEFEHAERVVEDVALLQDMAAGKLDERGIREAAEVLLEHRQSELPSVSVAVAARLLDVSRTTVEAWRSTGVLTSAVKRRRHEVTVDSLVRLQALISELRQLGRIRQLRDYVWWSHKTLPTTPTGSSPKPCGSCAPGSLPRNMLPPKKI